MPILLLYDLMYFPYGWWLLFSNKYKAILLYMKLLVFRGKRNQPQDWSTVALQRNLFPPYFKGIHGSRCRDDDRNCFSCDVVLRLETCSGKMGTLEKVYMVGSSQVRTLFCSHHQFCFEKCCDPCLV
nr:hypothetical protein Iba_chr01aCG2910 [Ipomoea batatas]GME03698.1 hypothetical protein Iba_scaffold1050CG0200 [Ipomoea batatas]